MASSLKISLKVPKLSTEQPTKAASRKTNKRCITSDDESDDTVSSQTETSLRKPLSKKPRLSHADDLEPERPTQPPRTHSSKPTVATAPKPRTAAGVAKKPLKTKKRIVSDDDDDNDEEFVPEAEEKPTVVGAKPKNKDMKGKVKLVPGRGATIGTIVARNESISSNLSVSSPSVIDNKRVCKEDDGVKEQDMEVDITSIPPAPSASMPAPAPDVDPPRKKLPTIKKKTKSESATKSASVSCPVPPAKVHANVGKPNGTGSARPQLPPAAGPSTKPAAPVQATIMNPSGSGDFDLRDMNTWASLIGKGTSSSGPRVGVEKRVSTEERRKQLDKMRDEARARREEQHRHTFDLQAQSQKVATFERKLASHRIRIPGPNILGAAFKVRPIPRS